MTRAWSCNLKRKACLSTRQSNDPPYLVEQGPDLCVCCEALACPGVRQTESFSSLLQVMALIAYLMEHKNNYGPHLIIVPNAVMVNWKAELTAWLPSAKCVYYVGHKDDRARKFNLEVASLQFNVLVTTYEYIMRDRAKLSKVCSHSAEPSRNAAVLSHVHERDALGLSWCPAPP